MLQLQTQASIFKYVLMLEVISTSTTVAFQLRADERRQNLNCGICKLACWRDCVNLAEGRPFRASLYAVSSTSTLSQLMWMEHWWWGPGLPSGVGAARKFGSLSTATVGGKQRCILLICQNVLLKISFLTTISPMPWSSGCCVVINILLGMTEGIYHWFW